MSKLLEYKNKEPYPLLDKYLEFDKNKKRNASTKKNNEKNYCLDNVYIF